MLQSKLFAKTLHEDPKDEISINAKLLSRAGFIHKLMAGAYQYLPLGLRTLVNIENIIREEMNKLGANEVLMPALHPKEYWEKTGRFHGFDALFKVVSHFDKEFALAPTHEESIVPLVQRSPLSYKDFPFALYQIQTKFRDEPRAKSGLLRGREFRMKDLYSFHTSVEDLDNYYEKSKQAYLNVFKRCGLNAEVVEASGGVFSKFSHEFQVMTEYGEDDVYYCAKCSRHQNKELVTEGSLKCPYCGADREIKKSIEVGNIFRLLTRFTDPFEFTFKDEDGKDKPVVMGCYGIGPSRVLGSVVEIHHDDNGIIWPEAIAPFQIHLISLAKTDEERVRADQIYNDLLKSGKEVLYDDRESVTAGAKFADSDLIGIPVRYIVSAKTLEKDSVEVKNRGQKESKLEKLSV